MYSKYVAKIKSSTLVISLHFWSQFISSVIRAKKLEFKTHLTLQEYVKKNKQGSVSADFDMRYDTYFINPPTPVNDQDIISP